MNIFVYHFSVFPIELFAEVKLLSQSTCTFKNLNLIYPFIPVIHRELISGLPHGYQNPNAAPYGK
jgi:hypothetical protein